jgi:hypothetical protein
MLKTAIKLENLAKLDGGCRIPSKFEILGLINLLICPNSCLKKFFLISLQNGPKLMFKTAIKLENLTKLDGGCRLPSKFEILGLINLLICQNCY